MKECIYVVEDDENIREIIDLALTSAGFYICGHVFRYCHSLTIMGTTS